MKTTLRNCGSATLLACVFLGLTARNASCQVVARRSSVQATYYAGAAGTVYTRSAYTPYVYAPGYYTQTVSPYQAYPINPNTLTNPYALSANASRNTTRNTPALAAQTAGPPPPPASQTESNGLTAQRLSNGDLLLQWHGDVSRAQQVEFGLFDANGQMLAHQVVAQLPVQAEFTPVTTAASYGVQITYANGTTSTTYLPIRN